MSNRAYGGVLSLGRFDALGGLQWGLVVPRHQRIRKQGYLLAVNVSYTMQT